MRILTAIGEWVAIIWGLLVTIVICLGLLVWAFWQDAKVWFFRLIRANERADRIQAKADRSMRQLCGVPEPDGDYYGCGFPG